MSALDHLGGALDRAGGLTAALGSAGIAAGIQLSSGMENASAASEQLDATLGNAGDASRTLGALGEDTGQRIRNALQNAADASDGLGKSFAKNFTQAQNAGKSFEKSIRTGIAGAFDTATQRVKKFGDSTVSGMKKVGNAVLHPVQTIKGKFSSAMKDAAKDTDKLGDEAKKSGKELDDMGKSGSGAGEKMQKGLGAALKVIGAIAAAAVVFTGIAKFTSAAMNASQAAQNVAYSFNQTFGDSAPDVQAWAENFGKAVHRSETEVKGFLTTNKQFYEGLGVTGQAAMDLSKVTTSLAYDIGSKFGIEDAEALSALQDAISGNDQALSTYGVTLNAAALNQTALSMGLKGSLDDMDEATLAQVRMNTILGQTGDLQESATKSLGGFSGGIKALKAGFTDFLEKAGAKLAPTFDKIFSTILTAWPQIEPALLSLVDLLANGFEQALPVVMQFAADLLPQLTGLLMDLGPLLMDLGGQLLPLVAQVFGVVVQAVGPLMPLIGTLANTLLPPLSKLFGNLVSTLLPPLASLLGAIAPLFDALSPILNVVAGGIEMAANALAGLIELLTKGIAKVGEFAQSLKNSDVGQFVGGVGDKLSGAAGAVKNFFAGNAKGTDNFAGGWTRINETGGELIHAKHDGGIAYLPRGSAVIPASKTDEILSGDRSAGGKIINLFPQLEPKWTPVVLEGNPNRKPDDGTNDTPPPPAPVPDTDDPNKPPPPKPVYPNDGGGIIRKIVEINVTVSSADGSVPLEVREQIREEARKAAMEAYREMQDSDFRNLAIQNGYAG